MAVGHVTTAGGPASDDPRRVLLVRPSALGDVCRTVPVLASLRRAWPEARIDWLVRSDFADAVAHHPDLTRVLPFDRRRFGRAGRSIRATREALQWLGHLRGQRYDVAFDLQGLFRSALFTWATRAPRRVGFRDAREGAALAYNRRHGVEPALHTVDRMLALIAAEGIEPVRDLRLYPGSDDVQWRETWLAEQDATEATYAVIAPTARWWCKCWPIERYIELTRRLLDATRGGGRVVVLAAPAELPAIAPLLEAFAADRRVMLPTTTVGQMLAMIARASLVVCNDSAALHMAVGLQRPVVAVFGPTDPARVGPYGRPDAVVQPPDIRPADMLHYRHRRDDQSLIAKVTLDAVWQRIEQQLGADS